MFSNIPINLLSETQLGGCTALSCVLGRRREEREIEELTFVPTRRGMSVNQHSVLIHVVTHIHAHKDIPWLVVATQYISSLVGFYVDFRSVCVCVCLCCTDSQMASAFYASVN